uniref:C-type lectin domain-containing protein n=1 Tax=Chelydra serpentina TaxID=8475 RepID=A0A8C3SD11_CHESE
SYGSSILGEPPFLGRSLPPSPRFEILTLQQRHPLPLASSLAEFPSPPSSDISCVLCPCQWISNKGRCYYFSADALSWSDSRSSCQREKADLVIITGSEEQDFLSKRQRQADYWIGLTDMDQEGSWKWVDGTDINQMETGWKEDQGWGLGCRRGSEVQAPGGTYLKQLPEAAACPSSGSYAKTRPDGSAHCPMHRCCPCSSRQHLGRGQRAEPPGCPYA